MLETRPMTNSFLCFDVKINNYQYTMHHNKNPVIETNNRFDPKPLRSKGTTARPPPFPRLPACTQQKKLAAKEQLHATCSGPSVHLLHCTMDKTRQDKTGQDKTRQGKTRQGKARQDKTRRGKTRQDKTRQDKTRQDKTRQDKTRQDKT